MQHQLIRIAIALGAAFPAVTGLAQPDACDDQLSRHHRRDLKPVAVSFSDDPGGGAPAQLVRILLRNVGEEPMPGAPTEGVDLGIVLGTHLRGAHIPGGTPSGGNLVADIRLPAGTLTHCAEVRLRIDTARTAGQWGCQVFLNDAATLVATRVGRICAAPRPGPRPIPTPG